MTPFAARLRQAPILAAPGVYDPMSAALAEKAGFEVVFVSGAALAFSQLARPDIGLLTLSETASVVARICERVSIPVMVDVDQGFGNASMVRRTIRAMEGAGAAAIQIEDQVETKPVRPDGPRQVLTVPNMLGKLRAAQDARRDERLLISARTDAAPALGVDAAIERACAFAAEGADLVFVEGLTARRDIERLAQAVAGRTPLVHNLLDGRPSEVEDAATLEAMGYAIVLFPMRGLAAASAALEAAFAGLHASAVVSPAPLMADIQARIDTAAFLEATAASIESS